MYALRPGIGRHRWLSRGKHAPGGLTLLETVVSLALIATLMSILVPALSSARMVSYREHCASNQRCIGEAWAAYLDAKMQQFPFVPNQPGWRYGGVRFSTADGSAFSDTERPLNEFLTIHRTANYDEVVWCCPADSGITDPKARLGTGRRTAFRSFGTSYRANALLLDARLAGVAEADEQPRGIRRGEITIAPSRMLVMGDPVWYEVAEETSLSADWHGEPAAGNFLFLDGSVRYLTVRPRRVAGPIVFDPVGKDLQGVLRVPQRDQPGEHLEPSKEP